MTLFDVLEVTWPPERVTKIAGFELPEAPGAGKRVNAAVERGPVHKASVSEAEDLMRARGMAPLFRVDGGQDELDALLAGRGYSVIDPVVFLEAPARAIAGDGPDPVTAFPVWPPLSIMHEVWDSAGTVAERREIMNRADCAKTSVMGRTRDTPAGCAFVGLHDGVAMLHALEVLPEFRRSGVAQNIVRAAAAWSVDQGAARFTALTVVANAPARALFASLGMEPVEKYHYRILEP